MLYHLVEKSAAEKRCRGLIALQQEEVRLESAISRVVTDAWCRKSRSIRRTKAA